MLRRARDFLVTYVLLATLAVLILLWTLLALLLLSWLPGRWRRAAVRRTMMEGFRLFSHCLRLSGAYRLDLAALDSLRAGPALILAPNHPTAIDAILLLTRHPDLACVLKPELLRNVFLGAGARLAGFIRSDPPRRMVRDAVGELARGGSVLLFPEGTRTRTSPVNPLKGSVAVIARHAAVPIQVLIIETDSPYLGKGWPFFKAPRLPIRYRVRLGQRLHPPHEVSQCMRSLEHEYATQLATAFQSAWLNAGICGRTATPSPQRQDLP